MTIATVAFALGVLWLQSQPALLPSDAFLVLGISGALMLSTAMVEARSTFRLLRLLFPAGAFLLGLVWSGWCAQVRLADNLAMQNEGRDFTVVGVVAALPQRFENGLRFDFDVEQAPPGVPQKISLAWYRGFRTNEDDDLHVAPELRAGERWRLMVKLKRPHGNINPHSFDYEAWLFEADIRATGYVRPSAANERTDEFVPSPGYAVERLRQLLRERIQSALPDHPYAGVLVALAVGDQRAIDPPLWQIFAQTGLTHLMSISGLHVTMVAALVYGLVGWLWRRYSFGMLRLPAQQAAAVGGVLGALGYCLLAGFQVPAQRTLYMLSAVALALWTRRNVSTTTALAFALLIVLLFDPWAVLSAGFWLSFGAVALLLFISAGRLGKPHWLREWGRAQWAVTIGMIPALLALFQQFSLVSPLANAVAIPLVSIVVTPLTLAACVLPAPLHAWLLWAADALTTVMMWWVEWLSSLPWAVWQQHSPPAWALFPAVLGIGWLLLPKGFPARWVGGMMLVPLVLVPPQRPESGAATVVVLDVGQGLAVHVQTAAHDLLFDTGPLFSPEANSGNRIIVPYLRSEGVRRLDVLVVTHQDTDHSGGAESVIDAVPIGEMLDSLPFEHDLSAAPLLHQACSDGQRWAWDGVLFEMLYPPKVQYDQLPRKTNDMSCVLKVTAYGKSILLTSDIEALSEQRLLAVHGADLKSDVLLAPHHGSRTSSTPAFIAAVAAPTVVFPVGYQNRFHHPHPAILDRYRVTNASLLRTDTDGAVLLRFQATGIAITQERLEQKRYWHGQ